MAASVRWLVLYLGNKFVYVRLCCCQSTPRSGSTFS